MTEFILTMEGVVLNLARVRLARREKLEGKPHDGLYVWRLETDFGGVYRVPDNGATPFNVPRV